MELDHLLILANDMSAMRAFFVDVVGLEDGERPAFPFPGHWLYAGGRPIIHLASAQADSERTGWLGASPTSGAGPIDHLALKATDYSALLARLVRLDHAHTIRRVPAEDVVQVFVPGPEGVKVEIQFPLAAVPPPATTIMPAKEFVA